jgi:hypothetical protein
MRLISGPLGGFCPGCVKKETGRNRVMVAPLVGVRPSTGGLGDGNGRTRDQCCKVEMVPTNFRPNGDSTMATGVGWATVPVVVHLATSGDRDRRKSLHNKVGAAPTQRVSWGGHYDASCDRLDTEFRRSNWLWRNTRYTQFQLAQLQQAECSRLQRLGACDIGSAGGRGKLGQRRSKLHHAVHAHRTDRHGDLQCKLQA